MDMFETEQHNNIHIYMRMYRENYKHHEQHGNKLTETVRQAFAMLVLRVLRQRRRLCRAHELGPADLADYRH